MIIARARLYCQTQPFVDGPYTCRGHTEQGFESAIVALEATDGTIGWGEAAPLGAFYAEAFPEAIRAGIIRLLPDIIGLSADDPQSVRAALDHAMFGQPAVKSAIDMAAWDLSARLRGLSLADATGGDQGGDILLYRSISQAAPEAMARRAVELVSAGYRRLQVKVGAEPQGDIARMRAVLAAIDPGVKIYADANGAWQPDDAITFVEGTTDLDYALEQPCMRADENLAVFKAGGRRMILDEGIVSLDDLLAARDKGMLAGVTLKIARVGGISPTVAIRDQAVAFGLPVTIEDTGGSTIDTAATAHLMASTPLAYRAHTVDFMNWVTVQNATGMPQTSGGKLLMPDGAGIGINGDLSLLGDPIAEA